MANTPEQKTTLTQFLLDAQLKERLAREQLPEEERPKVCWLLKPKNNVTNEKI